jgi:hypothetical protein
VSEYIDNERNKREVVFNGKGSTKDLSSRVETTMASYNKTGMPTMQLKKRKAEEAGKYFNMEAHKIKTTPKPKNEDCIIKKIGPLESLPSSYSKNLQVVEDLVKVAAPAPIKKNKLPKIEDSLLSTAARQLPALK